MTEQDSFDKTEMNRYNNSKIYMLRDEINACFYIGSTCNSLSKRLSQHKYDIKKKPTIGVYNYFSAIGADNIKIILMEEHYLDNKEQLLREEDRVIQMYRNDEKCLNQQRAFVGLNKQEYNKLYR